MSRALLLSCEAVGKAFGTRRLFDELSFGLFEGDRAGLVGPNGSGKSTLLKILAGLEAPDRGTRSLRGGVRIGYVPQDPVFADGLTVDDVIAMALADVEDDERPGRIARTRRDSSRPGGRTASSSPGARNSCAARPPGRNRWPTWSGGRSSGSAGAPRRARPRPRGVSRKPAG